MRKHLTTLRSARAAVGAAAAAAALGTLAGYAHAIAWNATQPGYSAVSATGLLDRPGMFLNEHVVANATGSRGTGTYLGDGWVLTAQHVIQNGDNYAQLASPSQISLNVNLYGWSQSYTADALYVPTTPGGPDIALVHLAGTSSGLAGALPGVLKSQINTSPELNRIVQIGGYGYYGPLGGTMATDASFHRAYGVVGFVGSDQLTITANANARLLNNGYVLGAAQPGDSGSGIWLNPGDDANDNTYDYALAGALATGNGSNFGGTNVYKRTASYTNWILTTAYASRGVLTWDADPATPGIQDGSGTWNLSSANFGNGVDNFAWDNSSTKTLNVGWHKGPAGAVTLAQSVTLQNLVFNPALSGSYTLAGGGGVTLNLASPAFLAAHADATISANLSGGNVNKAGVGRLTLSGNNTLSGTLTIGGGSTTGGNVNGTLRITRTESLAGVTQINLLDNNAAYATLELDGSTAPITLPASTKLNLNANFAGPLGTPANVLRNVAGDNTIAGNITFNSGGPGYGITVDANSSLTFAGTVTNGNNSSAKTFYLRGAGNGAFAGAITSNLAQITVVGPGAWSLTANNTYGGITTVAAGGTLSTDKLASGNTPSGVGQSAPAAPNLQLLSGALRYTGPGATTDRTFTIGAGGATLDASGTGPLVFSSSAPPAMPDPAPRAARLTEGSSVVTLTAGGSLDLAPGTVISAAGLPTGTAIFSVNHDAGTVKLNTTPRASLDTTFSFTVPTRRLTLAGSSAAANILAASLTDSPTGGTLSLFKTGQGAWTLAGTCTYTGTTSVQQGVLTLAPTASLASTNVGISPGALLVAQGTLPAATILISNGDTRFVTNTLANGPHARQLAALRIGSAGVVTVEPSPSHANRTVIIIAGGLDFVGASPATPKGQLDLTTNDLILRNASLAKITAQLAAGSNNGSWDGQGVMSSAADTTAGTALGVLSNDDGAGQPRFTTFDNQPVTAADVLVKYTWLGDTNLDGLVTAADRATLESSLLQPPGPKTWSTGDFNYDGQLTPDDLALFTLGAALSAGQDITTIPESAAQTLLATFAAPAFMTRRTRRCPESGRQSEGRNGCLA